MRQVRWMLLLALAWAGSAQIPASGTLPAAQEGPFRAELKRLEKLGQTAADPNTVRYALARTLAAGEQWTEAVEQLRRIEPGCGIDAAKDRIFTALRSSSEFAAITDSARRAATRITNSRVAFRIAEGDLAPESLAYDPRTRTFYFGSLRKGKVVRCSRHGVCRDFITRLDTVLGLKVDGSRLLVLNNSEQDSALMSFELETGTLIRKWSAGAGHLLNDLVVAPDGEIIVTDTRGAAVWRLAANQETFERLPGRFEFANGIAISPDGRRLYVSTFPDGVTVLDRTTLQRSGLTHPAGVCLANVDGLYWVRDQLIAIQNGIMFPRVIRMVLGGDGKAVVRFEVLERGHPLFEGITTGVMVGRDFFFMANIQDDRESGFAPITILSIRNVAR